MYTFSVHIDYITSFEICKGVFEKIFIIFLNLSNDLKPLFAMHLQKRLTFGMHIKINTIYYPSFHIMLFHIFTFQKIHDIIVKTPTRRKDSEHR